MTGRPHHSHLKQATVVLVNVWFKPHAFLREILGYEGCKIASHLGVQAGLALQRTNHGVGGFQMLAHLIKHVVGIHLHAPCGLGYLLGGQIHEAHIAGVGLRLKAYIEGEDGNGGNGNDHREDGQQQRDGGSA